MSSRRPAAAAALLALPVLLLPLCQVGAAGAAAASTCQGVPVTVEGALGTEGDDVMRAPLNAWELVEGRGGNDTICLVDGRPGSRDPQFFADAGPGDDVVVYEATYSATVQLGAGADRFVGNDTGVTVKTGAEAPIADGVGYFGQTDTDADVVVTGAGRDQVYSGDTTAYLTNADRIATGDSSVDRDSVFYAGAMTPDGALDNGVSRDLLYLVGAWPTGTLSLDNATGRATLGGREVLRWTGVRSFSVDERPEALRFAGTPRADDLRVGDSQLQAPGAPMTVDVSMRGGADHLDLAGALQGRVSTGSGGDELWLGGGCERTRARVGSSLVCTQDGLRSRTSLSGIDRFFARGSHVVAIGTTERDVIGVFAAAGRVEGRGGSDRLEAVGREVVVDGGPGRDRCTAKVRRACER